MTTSTRPARSRRVVTALALDNARARPTAVGWARPMTSRLRLPERARQTAPGQSPQERPAGRGALLHARGPVKPEFADVYDEHIWDVYGYLAYRLDSREEAEDLTQVTFERALRAWRRYDSRRAAPRTWLLSIAHNILIDHYRATGAARPVTVPDEQADGAGTRSRGRPGGARSRALAGAGRRADHPLPARPRGDRPALRRRAHRPGDRRAAGPLAGQRAADPLPVAQTTAGRAGTGVKRPELARAGNMSCVGQ